MMSRSGYFSRSLGVGRRVFRFSDQFKPLLLKGYVGTVEPTLGGGGALLALDQLRLLLNWRPSLPPPLPPPRPAERGASQLSRPAWRRVRGGQLQHRSCSLLLSTSFIRPPPFPSVIPPSSLCQWTSTPPHSLLSTVPSQLWQSKWHLFVSSLPSTTQRL